MLKQLILKKDARYARLRNAFRTALQMDIMTSTMNYCKTSLINTNLTLL